MDFNAETTSRDSQSKADVSTTNATELIGEGCKINMAIIDKDVSLSPGTEIGYNYEEDKRKYFMDEESSIVVIPKEE